MWEIFIFGLIIVFACMGLSELIHSVHMALVAPNHKKKTFSVVMLEGEDAKAQLIYAGMQNKWLGKSVSEYKIAAYGALAPQEKELCEKIANKYDMIFCPKEALEHIISTLSEV